MSNSSEGPSAQLHLSAQSIFYSLASLSLFGLMLVTAESLLVPFAFGLLIAMILYPVSAWLENRGVGRVWTIILVLFGVTVLLVGIGVLFSAQLVSMTTELSDFAGKLREIFEGVIFFLNDEITIVPAISEKGLKDWGTQWFSSVSGGLLKGTLSGTGSLLSGMVLCVIYVFLLLLYRTALARGLAHFVPASKRDAFIEMLHKMRTVGQQYVGGMFVLILILGVLNTVGLLIIGVDYPLFFGFLAAFLAVIPYIGTTLGGLLPALYSLMNGDPYWMPISVVLVFWLIQGIEGNFLSPKIVGGNLNINPLAAILALITGGLVWGVAGMILFLPYAAVVKVACDHYTELRPMGMLLQDDLYSPKETKLIKKVKKLLKME